MHTKEKFIIIKKKKKNKIKITRYYNNQYQEIYKTKKYKIDNLLCFKGTGHGDLY